MGSALVWVVSELKFRKKKKNEEKANIHYTKLIESTNEQTMYSAVLGSTGERSGRDGPVRVTAPLQAYDTRLCHPGTRK